MKILGIDASHRNTGVVVLEVFPSGKTIKDIVYADTLKTKKIAGALNEYEQVKSVVDAINLIKFQHSIYCSACEIAHFGRNFSSARNVGITWGVAIGTKSEAYTENQVRSMFPGKESAKERALAWVLANNFHLSKKVLAMDDHQVDAVCVAIYHYLTQYKVK